MVEISIYLLFLWCCFTTFLRTPYLVIRYINLKKVINNNEGKYTKCMSKVKIWVISVVCLPLTTSFVMFMCEFFGDSYFLGFFMLLGVLGASQFITNFWLAPKVENLEIEFEQSENQQENKNW